MRRWIKRNPGKSLIALISMITVIIVYLFMINKFNSNEQPVRNDKIMNIYGFSSLYWMIGIIGGCILITLIYVSVKKYRALHKKKKKKSNS